MCLSVLTAALNAPGNTAGSTVPGWDVNPYGSTGLSFFTSTSAPNISTTNGTAGVVPEPGTDALMGLGIAEVLIAVRRRKQS